MNSIGYISSNADAEEQKEYVSEQSFRQLKPTKFSPSVKSSDGCKSQHSSVVGRVSTDFRVVSSFEKQFSSTKKDPFAGATTQVTCFAIIPEETKLTARSFDSQSLSGDMPCHEIKRVDVIKQSLKDFILTNRSAEKPDDIYVDTEETGDNRDNYQHVNQGEDLANGPAETEDEEFIDQPYMDQIDEAVQMHADDGSQDSNDEDDTRKNETTSDVMNMISSAQTPNITKPHVVLCFSSDKRASSNVSEPMISSLLFRVEPNHERQPAALNIITQPQNEAASEFEPYDSQQQVEGEPGKAGLKSNFLLFIHKKNEKEKQVKAEEVIENAEAPLVIEKQKSVLSNGIWKDIRAVDVDDLTSDSDQSNQDDKQGQDDQEYPYQNYAVTMPLPSKPSIDKTECQHYVTMKSDFKAQLKDQEFLRSIASIQQFNAFASKSQQSFKHENPHDSKHDQKSKLPNSIFDQDELSQSQMPRPYVPGTLIDEELQEIFYQEFSRSMTRYEQLCQIPLQEKIIAKSLSHTNSFDKGPKLPAQIFMPAASGNLQQNILQGDQLGCQDDETSNMPSTTKKDRPFQHLGLPQLPIQLGQLKQSLGKPMSPGSTGSLILSACSSPSMIFSQTNQDRMTLQSVMAASLTAQELKSNHKKSCGKHIDQQVLVVQQQSSSGANVADSFQDASLQITQRTNFGLQGALGQQIASDEKPELPCKPGSTIIVGTGLKDARDISTNKSITEINFLQSEDCQQVNQIDRLGKEQVKKNLLEAFKEEQFERQMSNREIARTHRAALKEQVMDQERIEYPMQAEGQKNMQLEFYKSMQSQLVKSFNSQKQISGFEDQSVSQFSFKACSDHFRKYNSNYQQMYPKTFSKGKRDSNQNNTFALLNGNQSLCHDGSPRQLFSFDNAAMTKRKETSFARASIDEEQAEVSPANEIVNVERSSQFKDLKEPLIKDVQDTRSDRQVTEDLFLEEFLTEDEVAVFRSYLNDIPAVQQPFKLKQRKHPHYLQSSAAVEICFEDFCETYLPVQMRTRTSSLQNPQNTQKLKRHQQNRSKRNSLSLSQLEGEDEMNDTTVEDSHVSPKFERLQELVSMPNKDHSRSVLESHQHSQSINEGVQIRTAKSREKTCRRSSQHQDLSPITAKSHQTTQKHQQSFLSRVVQKHSAKKNAQPVTPSSKASKSDAEYKDCYGNPSVGHPSIIHSSKPGIASRSGDSPSTVGSRGLSPMLQSSSTIQIQGQHATSTSTVRVGCKTTTNQNNSRDMLGRQTHQAFNKTAQMQPRDAYGDKETGIKRRKTQNQHISNFQAKGGKMRAAEQSVQIDQIEHTEPNEDLGNSGFSQFRLQVSETQLPQDLKDWLFSIGLSQYGPLLMDQGFDDLPALIQMVGRGRILPLTQDTLKEIGIQTAGHRRRILVHLELASGSFENNQELINFLSAFVKQQRTENELQTYNQVSSHLSNVTSPAMMSSGITRIKFGARSVEKTPVQTDHKTPMQQNRTVHSPQPANSPSLFPGQPQQPLGAWLQKQNLLSLQPLFIRAGQDCLTSLFLQAYSQIVPLTDAVLKDEIGISKIGHRLRLLSQLRQDALTFFYEQCVANFNFDFNDLLMIKLNGHIAQQQQQQLTPTLSHKIAPAVHATQIQTQRTLTLGNTVIKQQFPKRDANVNQNARDSGFERTYDQSVEESVSSFEEHSESVLTSSPVRCLTRPTNASLAIQAHLQQARQIQFVQDQFESRNPHPQVTQSAENFRRPVTDSFIGHIEQSDFKLKQLMHQRYFRNPPNSLQASQMDKREKQNLTGTYAQARRTTGDQSCITF